MLTISLGLVLLVTLFLLGVPISFAFALVVMIVATFLGYDLYFLPAFAFDRIRSLILLAVPLFIIAGGLMDKGGIATPLVDFVDTVVGRVKGGLGAASAITNAIFGAISGSCGAAIGCIGSIMIPRLVEAGYPRGYASSLLTVSAGIALLIPPSYLPILYGWITSTSISACFLAGALPGVLLTILFIIINRFMVNRYPTVKKPPPWSGFRQTSKEIASSGWRALPALFMPVLILGTIYGGVATPTEAAAVAVVYAIPVGFLVYRGLTPRTFANTLIKSSQLIGAIMIMLFFAMIFSRLLVMENMPQIAAKFILSISENKYLLLLLINAFLFLLGMFIDDISGVIIAVPLLLPIVKVVGLSRVHFAAIIATNLTMGNLTPPMAPLLYLGQLIGKTTFADMIKPSLLFIFVGYLPVVLITTYWAPIAEWLPVAVYGAKVLIPA